MRYAAASYLALPENREQFASDDIIHDHIEVPDILKSTPHVDQERVFDSLQNHLFVVGVLDLFETDDLGLLEDLHCVESRVEPGLDQVNATERSGAERTVDAEIIEVELAPRCCCLLLWYSLCLLCLLLGQLG